MKFPKFLRRKKKQEAPSGQTQQEATPQTAIPDENPPSPVKIVYTGHRGSGANDIQLELPEPERTPENSLASFKKALNDGVESIEFDVYRSKDRVLGCVNKLSAV